MGGGLSSQPGRSLSAALTAICQIGDPFRPFCRIRSASGLVPPPPIKNSVRELLQVAAHSSCHHWINISICFVLNITTPHRFHELFPQQAALIEDGPQVTALLGWVCARSDFPTDQVVDQVEARAQTSRWRVRTRAGRVVRREIQLVTDEQTGAQVGRFCRTRAHTHTHAVMSFNFVI